MILLNRPLNYAESFSLSGWYMQQQQKIMILKNKNNEMQLCECGYSSPKAKNKNKKLVELESEISCMGSNAYKFPRKFLNP